MADLPLRFTNDLEDSLPAPTPSTGGAGGSDNDQYSTASTGRQWDRFTNDLEDSLPAPTPSTGGAGGSDNDQHSTASTGRRWDDPPEDEPTAPPENLTTMVFVLARTIPPYIHSTEILQLAFSPSDAHLTGMLPRVPNVRNFHPMRRGPDPCALVTWSAATGQRIPAPPTSGSSAGGRISGAFAFKPGTVDMVVACPFYAPFVTSPESPGVSGFMPRLEVFDLGRRERKMKKEFPIRAPLAWSADGSSLVAVSVRDPSRIVVIQIEPQNWFSQIKSVLMQHHDEVTQLGFLPVWEEGGKAMVSAAKDGYVRVTSIASGKTLKRIEIGARAPASMLQVSPDGKLVVTVWGRDVVLWFLETGRVHTYNLNVVRQTEGWPLCVSPCCSYLACRTEEGFDVSDVVTGKFRGEFAKKGEPITAAAFNNDGTRLAVGNYVGNIGIYEIITA